MRQVKMEKDDINSSKMKYDWKSHKPLPNVSNSGSAYSKIGKRMKFCLLAACQIYAVRTPHLHRKCACIAMLNHYAKSANPTKHKEVVIVKLS